MIKSFLAKTGKDLNAGCLMYELEHGTFIQHILA